MKQGISYKIQWFPKEKFPLRFPQYWAGIRASITTSKINKTSNAGASIRASITPHDYRELSTVWQISDQPKQNY